MTSFCLTDCLQNSIWPERVALESENLSYSYSDLAQCIAGLSLHLRELGVAKGDSVGIALNSHVQSFLLALATNWLGASWFRGSRETIYSHELFYQHVFSDSGRPKPPQGVQHFFEEDLAFRQGSSPRPAYRFHEQDIVVFGQSSGTTGTPKILPMTAAQLQERSKPELLLDDSLVPCVASGFHPLHIVSFYTFLRTLRKGGKVIFGSANESITHLLLSPALAAGFVENAKDRKRKIYSCWIGGGPLYTALTSQLLNHFERVVYTYGSQEAGNAAYRIIADHKDIGDTGDVGALAPNVELRVVDEMGQVRVAGEIGEVCYRTPSVIDGYVGSTSDSSIRDGFFFPGDMGKVNFDGTLSITGRLVERLNIGGAKISAAWLEEVVSAVDGVKDAGACTVVDHRGSEMLVVGYQSRASSPPNLDALITARLTQEFGKVGERAVLRELETVPRNENGKIDRARLAICLEMKLRESGV